MTYTFPPVRFVEENTADEQLDHFFSEAVETYQAQGIDQHREAADAYHSLETFFRILEKQYGHEYVRDAVFQWVEEKNRAKGHYGEKR